jgi:hypothetical protein
MTKAKERFESELGVEDSLVTVSGHDKRFVYTGTGERFGEITVQPLDSFLADGTGETKRVSALQVQPQNETVTEIKQQREQAKREEELGKLQAAIADADSLAEIRESIFSLDEDWSVVGPDGGITFADLVDVVAGLDEVMVDADTVPETLSPLRKKLQKLADQKAKAAVEADLERILENHDLSSSFVRGLTEKRDLLASYYSQKLTLAKKAKNLERPSDVPDELWDQPDIANTEHLLGTLSFDSSRDTQGTRFRILEWEKDLLKAAETEDDFAVFHDICVSPRLANEAKRAETDPSYLTKKQQAAQPIFGWKEVSDYGDPTYIVSGDGTVYSLGYVDVDLNQVFLYESPEADEPVAVLPIIDESGNRFADNFKRVEREDKGTVGTEITGARESTSEDVPAENRTDETGDSETQVNKEPTTEQLPLEDVDDLDEYLNEMIRQVDHIGRKEARFIRRYINGKKKTAGNYE